ncbi:YczE/YyaS/YitT family protein [Heyndrickxia acidiproducens]|uniref:YczE/YyaS/YitT family protein n=1 Tax=Heyndrickxia acidiproducens TaxID=1121084 RepID=UPI00035D0A54|nr:YitT family protein [Heyndrickxia acidiproducens]
MEYKGDIYKRLAVFTAGLLVMSFGIDLFIVSGLGATPWDTLHVGLYEHLGLSIGSWSIIVGFFVLGCSALFMKEWPQFGAYLNMILCGLFIDLFLKLPFMVTPDTLMGKMIMFAGGLVINGYGMGIYISARLGAGPRDSFMLAVNEKTGWKVSNVRRGMEVLVLLAGYLLGGPVYIGTILYSLVIGTIVGFALPECQWLTDKWLKKAGIKKQGGKDVKRGATF